MFYFVLFPMIKSGLFQLSLKPSIVGRKWTCKVFLPCEGLAADSVVRDVLGNSYSSAALHSDWHKQWIILAECQVLSLTGLNLKLGWWILFQNKTVTEYSKLSILKYAPPFPLGIRAIGVGWGGPRYPDAVVHEILLGFFVSLNAKTYSYLTS